MPFASVETGMVPTVAKQTRPGGRTEKNRRAVAAAVLKLIGDGNLDFELQDVAALSGVHRTTLFRRWPDRGALIAEAMAEHVARVSIDLTGDWQVDLRRIAYGMRDFLSDPIELAMNRMLAITDNELFHDQMARHWAPILARFQEPIRNAQQVGQVASQVDAEMVVTTLITPLLSHCVFLRQAPDDAFVDRLIAQIAMGCVQPSAGPSDR